MTNTIREMVFPVKSGLVILQWPEDIGTECLDLIEEVIALQLRSVRRYVTRREAVNVTDKVLEGE